MVAGVRTIGGRRHVLSDHSLDRITANRLADRHRKLGINAKIVPNGKNKFAIYRNCKLQRVTKSSRPTKKIIHVNQAMIAHNRKNPNDPKPPITIQTNKGSLRASSMKIEGPSNLIYNPLQPLQCGARLYIETKDPVILDDCTRLI